ncbi:MAG TPA: hypothetical protein V6D33_00445 [Cyanophyceae cyanobacterium]
MAQTEQITIFQHETTKQVIEVPEIKPGVFEALGTPMEMSIMNTCGWWECETDPNYRGMPPAQQSQGEA